MKGEVTVSLLSVDLSCAGRDGTLLHVTLRQERKVSTARGYH